MGTFYGGIAHVPISSLIMVSDLAGSYDLLVPLMLSVGVAFVALRRRSLYHAQVPTHIDSEVHRAPAALNALTSIRVAEIARRPHEHTTLRPGASVAEMSRARSEFQGQSAFPVVDPSGKVLGIVGASAIAFATAETAAAPLTLAADLMQPVPVVRASDDLRKVAELFLSAGLRQLPVLDDHGGSRA